MLYSPQVHLTWLTVKLFSTTSMEFLVSVVVGMGVLVNPSERLVPSDFPFCWKDSWRASSTTILETGLDEPGWVTETLNFVLFPEAVIELWITWTSSVVNGVWFLKKIMYTILVHGLKTNYAFLLLSDI